MPQTLHEHVKRHNLGRVFVAPVDVVLDPENTVQPDVVFGSAAGDLIRGSGGIRKVRWSGSGSGRGKRGGLRVIYYWWVAKDRISMLLVYRKNEQDDLSVDQLKLLRKALEI